MSPITTIRYTCQSWENEHQRHVFLFALEVDYAMSVINKIMRKYINYDNIAYYGILWIDGYQGSVRINR